MRSTGQTWGRDGGEEEAGSKEEKLHLPPLKVPGRGPRQRNQVAGKSNGIVQSTPALPEGSKAVWNVLFKSHIQGILGLKWVLGGITARLLLRENLNKPSSFTCS